MPVECGLFSWRQAMSHGRYSEMINHEGLHLNLSYLSYCHIFCLSLLQWLEFPGFVGASGHD